MGREVVTEDDVLAARQRRAAAGGLAAGSEPIPTRDDYTDRLIKYIPAEIVGVYLSADILLRTADSTVPRWSLAWILFLFLLVMTPIYLRRVEGVKKYQQLGIATLSFVIWVFTLGGPFAQYPWYHPFYGAFLLPLYTFSVATIEAKR